MDTTALFKLTYGLFLLTAKEQDFDNGCIINTAIQIANNPTRIAVSVIQTNKTHDMILHTGEFNISSITTETDFGLFQHFGMQSGATVDKFADYTNIARSTNGLYHLTDAANMYLSAKVTEHFDLGSHTLFIGEVTDAHVLSDKLSCTYEYYQTNIKPKSVASQKRSWTCSICGYVYEGDEIPDDYLCPLCSHGKEDFVLTGGTDESSSFIVTDSTKRNLELSIKRKKESITNKYNLAMKAKEHGLDAIHDTVHEMARDDSRHGNAFEGMLKRYYG